MCVYIYIYIYGTTATTAAAAAAAGFRYARGQFSCGSNSLMMVMIQYNCKVHVRDFVTIQHISDS